MFRVEIIGNLGADVQKQSVNGSEFYTFRVADSQRFTDPKTGEVTERTTWFSCITRQLNDGLLPYLVAGQRVFVRGRAELRTYSSEKYKTIVASCDVQVSEIELCGASKSEREFMANAREVFAQLDEKGYDNVAEIPVNKKK